MFLLKGIFLFLYLQKKKASTRKLSQLWKFYNCTILLLKRSVELIIIRIVIKLYKYCWKHKPDLETCIHFICRQCFNFSNNIVSTFSKFALAFSFLQVFSSFLHKHENGNKIKMWPKKNFARLEKQIAQSSVIA